MKASGNVYRFDRTRRSSSLNQRNFDNSRDEAMAGHCDHIEVVLLPGNKIRVADNGRGIPVDVHKQTKVSALETIMTTLHMGGKLAGKDTGYKVSGGLHGVGASVKTHFLFFQKFTETEENLSKSTHEEKQNQSKSCKIKITRHDYYV